MLLPILACAHALFSASVPARTPHAGIDTVLVAANHTGSDDSPAAAAEVVADSVVIAKHERRLTLFSGGRAARTYLVALGQQPVGDKVQQGDMRTPEGTFRIAGRNPRSRYHLALRISYPDAAHRARARALGVSPGGDIMIHGLPDRQAWVGAAHRDFDWTEGCIAVTNQEIEEIWRAVAVGTPVHITP